MTPSDRRLIALSADFEPEDFPGLMTMTFLTDEGGNFGAGLYELRFVRVLDRGEREGTDGMLKALKNG